MNFIDPSKNYRIKGCTPTYINEMARKQYYNGIDINNIINSKCYEIVLNYSIKDCIKLILFYGDLYDSYIIYKYNCPIKFIEDNDINNDRILFHRELAFIYVKELIQSKIEIRINQILNFEEIIKDNNYDKTCSICLDLVSNCNNDNWFISKCNHIFHKKCISKWKRNTCPFCRKRNYK